MTYQEKLCQLLVNCERTWGIACDEVRFVNHVQVERYCGVKPVALLMQHALCVQVETIIRLMKKGHMFEPYGYDIPRLWDMMTNFESEQGMKRLLKQTKGDACKLNGFVQYGRYADSDMHVFELFENFSRSQEILEQMYDRHHALLKDELNSL